ncbi:MAG TPA: PKD domain-containing protein, partial [Candidatus Bathyarchaeota archaeon]|nr:PKD domain-containing protein [Candidatus Bathyarchaeota archaeon]
NYTWNFDDGTIITEIDPIITHNFTDVGTYNVTLLVFNDLGYNDTTWKLVTVSLPTAPEAIFTYYPTIVVANYTVTFNATESIPNDTTIVNYTWNFGDGTPEITETDPIVTHNFTSAGTYNVTLTVFNDANANDTTWQLITVLAEPPEPMLDIQPSTYVITHVGQTFNVTVRILNVTTYVKLVVTQFRLLYNSTYLTLLNVTEGPFFEAFPQRPDPPYTFFVWTNYPDDELYGSHVAVGNMLMPNDTGYWPGPFPEGDGVLATLTFNVTEGFNGMFPLDLTDTIMLDNNLTDITHSYTGPASVYSFFEIEITKQPKAWYNVTTVASMSFTIRYWNGTYYTPDNYSSIVVKVFDGTDYIEELAVYPSQFNPSTNEWTVTWIIPPYTPYLDTYQFVICAHDIEDNAGNTGPLIDIASSTFEVTGLAEIRFETLEVTIDVGSMHFPGEIAEFYILTTVSGFPCEVTTITATLYKPDGTNESLTVTEIDDGLFKADYIVPDLTGTYTLVVEASLMTYELEAHGASLRSFLVSSTLSGWITKIDGDIAWIKTNITDIKVSLDAINARLTSIEGTLATIETDVGTLQTTVDTIQANITSLIGTVAIIDSTLGQIELDIANLDAKITSLNGTVATISTTLGDIEASLDDLNAEISDISGDVVTIKTDVGTIKTTLDEIQDSINGVGATASTTLYVTSVLSAIAAVIGIIILWFLKKK